VPTYKLDIRPDEYEYFDFICAGWHFGAVDGLTPKGIGNTFSNFTRSTFEKATRNQVKRNTEATISVVESGLIKFLTHPGQRAPVDLLEIASVCARENVLLEINTSHMSFTPELMKEMEGEGASFIICSDAHRPERIADFQPAVDLLNESDIDLSRVENLRRI